jgi:hypothetical protein
MHKSCAQAVVLLGAWLWVVWDIYTGAADRAKKVVGKVRAYTQFCAQAVRRLSAGRFEFSYLLIMGSTQYPQDLLQEATINKGG